MTNPDGDRFANHAWVEPAIGERESHFPTDFSVSWGYRPDPHREMRRDNWWALFGGLIIFAIFFAVVLVFRGAGAAV